MIEKQAEKLVKQSINLLKQKEMRARAEDIAEKLAYYDFDRDQLEEYVSKYINRKETDIPYSEQNLTKKVIVRESVVYKKAPTRKFDKITRELESKYNQITIDKNESLKIVERQTNLLGRLALQICWDKEKKVFEYKMHRYFVPTFDLLGNIIQIVYELYTDLDNKRHFMVWTSKNNYIANEFGVAVPNQEEWGGNKDHLNPYGEIPFVYPYREIPIGGFWVEGATDVIEANEKLNFSLTLINSLERYATYKQGYVTGFGLEKQELEAGYNKWLTLEGEGSIGIIDLTANLDQIIKSIQFKVELNMKFHNLSCEWGGEGRATSGFQLIVENIDLLDMWKDQIEIWRKTERNIYEKEKIIAKIEETANLNLPDKMSVDFAEVEFPVNPQEQREQDEWDLKNDLTTKVKIMQRRNPDASEEELEEELNENIEKNKIFNQAVEPKPRTLQEMMGTSP